MRSLIFGAILFLSSLSFAGPDLAYYAGYDLMVSSLANHFDTDDYAISSNISVPAHTFSCDTEGGSKTMCQIFGELKTPNGTSNVRMEFEVLSSRGTVLSVVTNNLIYTVRPVSLRVDDRSAPVDSKAVEIKVKGGGLN